MAATAAPRGRAAVLSALALACGAAAFAWHLQGGRTPPHIEPDYNLPLWLEVGLFVLSALVAALPRLCAHVLVPRGAPSSYKPPAAPTSDATAGVAGDLTSLPQGAQSLLAILARALGQAEVALFVRQGSRLICRAQEPQPFGAQGLAQKLMGYIKDARPGHSLGALHLEGPRGVRSMRIAVPLYGDKDSARTTVAPCGPWAVLLAQRHTGPLGPSDQALVVSVAEQIAVSLQLEQALRLAQADRLRLEHMATTDSLTELANRRHFMRIFALQLARAERYTRKLSLIFLDIDHFKQVNDTFGHATGDEVLKGVAQVLRQTARKTDTVARYGGEEFAILMEETGLLGAQRIAERIQEALKKQPFGPNDAPFFKTVSVGVASFPEHGDEPERLIACADEALYQAKRNGRDQITLYRGPDGSCSSES